MTAIAHTTQAGWMDKTSSGEVVEQQQRQQVVDQQKVSRAHSAAVDRPAAAGSEENDCSCHVGLLSVSQQNGPNRQSLTYTATSLSDSSQRPALTCSEYSTVRSASSTQLLPEDMASRCLCSPTAEINADSIAALPNLDFISVVSPGSVG